LAIAYSLPQEGERKWPILRPRSADCQRARILARGTEKPAIRPNTSLWRKAYRPLARERPLVPGSWPSAYIKSLLYRGTKFRGGSLLVYHCWVNLVSELFAALSLAVHLLAVNVAAAGPLVCIWLHRRAARGDALADACGRRLAWWSFWGLVVGLGLGLSSLAIDWLGADDRYFRSFVAFPRRKLHFAAAEILCSLVWSGLYAALWQKGQKHPNWHALLGVLTATNLLYHFPPLLSAIAVSSTRPELLEMLQTQSTAKWMQHPEIASRTVHVWLASFAVTGVVLLAMAAKSLKDEALAPAARKLMAAAARLALLPTLLQILVGLWTLLTLPAGAQSSLMGADRMGTALLGISVLAALGLMHVLSAGAMGEIDGRLSRKAMVLMAIIVLLMSATLRRVRHLEAGYHAPAQAAMIDRGDTK
jgi:hypothetical protein